MNDDTKIALSSGELELVCNNEWILTKHLIIQKVYKLFGDLIPYMENATGNDGVNLPAEVLVQRARISKGENYRQLPYVMLDYPRHFNGNDVFAVRVFFWWGNFFSVTLHLSGSFKEQYTNNLLHARDHLAQNDYYVCVHNDPWQHHFGSDNYVAIKDMGNEELKDILYQRAFIKITKKISLRQWEKVSAFVQATFDELMQVLQTN